jgi:prepilin-type N-terminal cleavage/methylation domain-containing protein
MTIKNTNEQGFTLMELAVTAAIVATLGGFALTTILPAANTIVERAEEVQMINEQKAAEEAQILENLLNP